MKHIYLNLKRFDISPAHGGVNHIAPLDVWGNYIVTQTQEKLAEYKNDDVEFVMYMPEAHIINAVSACSENSPVKIGCQSVYRYDSSIEGNFGTFTTNRTANIAAELGCVSTIIGHCEERNDKSGMLAEAGIIDNAAVNRVLNLEIKAAQNAGLSVLYCIGEKSDEQDDWQKVLGNQLSIGLHGVDKSKIVIAYEPVWSIGPSKQPASKEYITKVAIFIKEFTGGLDIVYGGGLKKDNAKMLAGIQEIDGGLIALTRFQDDIGFYPDEYLEIIREYFR